MDVTQEELRKMLKDAIEKAKSIDLDKFEQEIEEESNEVARHNKIV